MNNSRMFMAMILGAIFRRRSRALMAVIATMVGAATLFCLAAVCIAVPQQMNEDMRSYGANLVVAAIEKQGAEKTGISDAMVAHTTSMVRAKSSAKFATYRYETVRINAAPYMLAGIESTQVRALNHHWSVQGSWPSHGAVMVGSDVASALGLNVGGNVTIAYQSSDNGGSTTSKTTQDGRVSTDILNGGGSTYRVAGIVNTGGSEDEIVYATNADVNALSGVKRGADVIEYSSSAMGTDLTAIATSINDMTSMGVKAQTVTKISSSDTKIITMLQTLFWLISVVVLALTFVGVGTTMTSIVSQRRNEIGLRKALGAPNSSIRTEFYTESVIYGLVGGGLGATIGFWLARLLCSLVFGRNIAMNWWLVGVAVVLSGIIAILATIRPVVKASRIDPAVVLSEE
ncbi:ABC transporter permease [Bifidobacterium aquikefiri]|uniref:ABC transporter permease n=1 Tax=Bifidobacterium aquikefiri TaxID=1653207 RepID=UPI0023F2A820|nr:FtsX-like permease family protein [Bifidobacterium aquikefiri]